MERTGGSTTRSSSRRQPTSTRKKHCTRGRRTRMFRMMLLPMTTRWRPTRPPS